MGDEILSDIDKTLDQLIENAEAMQEASVHMTEYEMEAFQKTQESLLAHLILMDQKLETKNEDLKKPNPKMAKYQIREKLTLFEKLNEGFIEGVSPKIKLRFEKRKKPASVKLSYKNYR